jgi:type VI secretion system protein VasD
MVDADINPDERKKPSPLFVRLYELKATKMFNKSDFIDIYERDKEVLGADLIAKQKLRRLKPGEDREDSFVLDPKTRYVALYAEFLRYENANYRVIIPVVPNNVVATDATIQISSNNIEVIKGAGYEDFEEKDSESDKTYKKVKKGAKKAGDTAEKAGEAGEKLKKLF